MVSRVRVLSGLTNLHGVFPRIPTPFDQGELNVPALRANIEHWMRTSVAGLVVLGSNGEAPLLDEGEANAIVAEARACVPRDRLLIVGTGRESTGAAIAATRRAANLGADAVLVRTPSYFRPQMTTGAFTTHFEAVADASPVPVLLYNFTALTGVSLEPTAVAKLSEHRNIVGMKESGRDIGRIAQLVDETPSNFNILVGSAQTFFPSLCVGTVGGVLALACLVPDLCMQLRSLVQEKRFAQARALQARLVPLAQSVTSTYGVPGLKAALDLVGYVGGDPRPPLVPVPPAAIEHIRRQLGELREHGNESDC